MELRQSDPVIVMDTSALVHLFVQQARNSSWPHRFRKAVEQVWGKSAQFVFHPLTLGELATNTHEEVLHARVSRRGPTAAAELTLRAGAHANALVALRACLDGPSLHSVFDFRVLPIVPDWRDYVFVAAQREDFRLLRCTSKNKVIPVAAMADHQILALALVLREDRYTVGMVSGDQELLGAAERFEVPLLYVHDLPRNRGFAWKDCASDGSCVAGCINGVSACDTMFV